MSDEFALDLGNQITVIIIDYKSNWTVTPGTCLVEVGKPFAMFFVLGVEYNPLSSE
jgi:hypothetical protein